MSNGSSLIKGFDDVGGASFQLNREPVRRIRVRSLILESVWNDDRTMEIAGIAWSGEGAISKIEVCWDGGSQWHTAQLEAPISAFDVAVKRPRPHVHIAR